MNPLRSARQPLDHLRPSADDDRVVVRRAVKIMWAAAAIGAGLTLLWWARLAVLVMYVSALVAMGVSPLISVLERQHFGARRLPRGLAVAVVYLGVLAVVVLVGLMVVPPLVAQSGELWRGLPKAFATLQTWLVQHGLVTTRVTFQEAVNAQSGGSDPGAPLHLVLTAGSRLFGGVAGLISVLILSFYFLLEGDHVVAYALRFVPAAHRPAVTAGTRHAMERVSAWMRANLILGGIMGTVCAVVLGLLGIPFFYVVALIAALGEMIPMVGPVIAGSVAIGIALTKSGTMALIVGAFFFVLHELEANVLVPKVMERGVGVSAVATVCALLIGWELAGILGAMLAIPTTALLAVIVEQVTTNRHITPVGTIDHS